MKNYSCIAIGINRYHYLQPLSYATADAQAIQMFLLEEAQIPSQQCLLLTDNSAWVEDKSTYPTRENIINWLSDQQLSRLQKKSSTLWFFFSGYGVNFDNEDYLMPIDGNPMDIPQTGIKIRSLFEWLNYSGSNILVILDFNRSSGIMEGNPVGQQTLHLAREMEISAVLSTSSEEFSHEAAALGHGIFTAALLEALRYYQENINLVYLDEYLRDRLPELSEHYWRPVQNPVTISPTLAASQKPILPSSVTTSHSKPLKSSTKIMGWEQAEERNLNAPLATYTPINLPMIEHSGEELLVTSQQEETPWLKWLLWGGSVMAVSMLILKLLGIEDTNQTKKPEIIGESLESPTPSPAQAVDPVLDLTAEELDKSLSSSNSYLRFLQASDFNRAIGEAKKVNSNESSYQQAQTNISRWSQVILDIANGRAAAGDYNGAIAAARLIPQDQFSVYTVAQVAIERWETKIIQQRRSQSLIQAAKTIIDPAQASSYNQAIMILRQVTPDEAGYDQAQELINQWSEEIYFIASSRAVRGDFPLAIETAKLVPADTSSYQKALSSISRWQQLIPSLNY